MTIKGVEKHVKDIMTAKTASRTKTTKKQERYKKIKKMIYLTPEAIEILEAFAFQNRTSFSGACETMIHECLKPKTKKVLLSRELREIV